MDIGSVVVLALQCSVLAPADIVASVAYLESEGNPTLVSINGEVRSQGNLDRSIAEAVEGRMTQSHVALGMGQVPLSKLQERGLTVTDGLSACVNLRVLGELIAELFEPKADTPDKIGWLMAAAYYATGTATGSVAEGYITQLRTLQEKIQIIEPRSPFLRRNNSTVPRQTKKEALKPNSPNPSKPLKGLPDQKEPAWDVFGSNKHKHKLMFN